MKFNKKWLMVTVLSLVSLHMLGNAEDRVRYCEIESATEPDVRELEMLSFFNMLAMRDPALNGQHNIMNKKIVEFNKTDNSLYVVYELDQEAPVFCSEMTTEKSHTMVKTSGNKVYYSAEMKPDIDVLICEQKFTKDQEQSLFGNE